MSTCGGCNKLISAPDLLSCTKCPRAFHYVCYIYTKDNYKKLSKESRALWKCPVCKSNQPKQGDKSETPVRSSIIQSGTESVSVMSPEFREEMQTLIHNEIQQALSKELPAMIREIMQTEMKNLRNEISSFKDTISFMNGKYDELNMVIAKREEDVKKLIENNNALQLTLKDALTRLSAMEQYSRSTNIEIHGLPEFRNEDLAKTTQQIGKLVHSEVEDCDILSCYRVAKINPASKRQRTVVIKFRSNRCRDTFMAAVANYNKKNRQDKLNTSLIGIGGDHIPIYVSEHLSPENKSLHAATRLKAKSLGYKFVWVRNGKIYIRKDESSQAKCVSCHDILKNLK